MPEAVLSSEPPALGPVPKFTLSAGLRASERLLNVDRATDAIRGEVARDRGEADSSSGDLHT